MKGRRDFLKWAAGTFAALGGLAAGIAGQIIPTPPSNPLRTPLSRSEFEITFANRSLLMARLDKLQIGNRLEIEVNGTEYNARLTAIDGRKIRAVYEPRLADDPDSSPQLRFVESLADMQPRRLG